MKNFITKTLGVFLVSCALFLSPAYATIVIDGNISDWGVTPGAYGASDWAPNSGIYSAIEDQQPGVDYLNPGYGGQAFDVEALYFTKDSDFAYIAAVSGFPLAGRMHGGQMYTAGDLTFDFGSDNTWEFGVETTGDLLGSVVGGLYGDATWTSPTFLVCGPFNLASGDFLGAGAFGYNSFFYSATDHYVFELAIPLNYFGNFWPDTTGTPDFSIKWTMSCGNDCLTLQVPFTPGVPEPATMVMVGFGILGLALKKRFFKV